MFKDMIQFWNQYDCEKQKTSQNLMLTAFTRSFGWTLGEKIKSTDNRRCSCDQQTSNRVHSRNNKQKITTVFLSDKKARLRQLLVWSTKALSLSLPMSAVPLPNLTLLICDHHCIEEPVGIRVEICPWSTQVVPSCLSTYVANAKDRHLCGDQILTWRNVMTFMFHVVTKSH